MPNRARARRATIVTAIVGSAAVLAAVLVPMSAQADSATLSGTIRNVAGKSMAGVAISLISPSGNPHQLPIATTTTNSKGAYSFDGLGGGAYTMWFARTSSTYGQYLGDTNDFKNLEWVNVYTTGGGKTYEDAVLASSGSVSGKVTKLPSGDLANYTVNAYAQADDGSWSVVSSTKTSSSGSYAVTGLAPGDIRLEAIDETSAHPAYSPEFSGGATTVGAATSVGIVANKTASYNFALGKAGSVSGTVTGIYNTTGSEKLGDVAVTAYRLNGTVPVFTSADALTSPATKTAPDGTYKLSGLNPGTYTLQFTPPPTAAASSTIYGSAFLGGADHATAANYFTIGNATAITGEDVHLVEEGKITGTVIASSGMNPLGNVRVEAVPSGQDPDDPNVHAVSTDTASDGTFELDGLGVGNYDMWVGSNEAPASDPTEDVSWIRQDDSLGSPVVAGQTLSAQFEMTQKNIDGLWPTGAFPTIDTSGGIDVGDTISLADNGTWDATPARYSYQWMTGEHVIAGATGTSYTLQPGDVSTHVYLDITAFNLGYGSRTVQSANSAGPVGNGTLPAPSPAPSVNGISETGRTLTVSPGRWDVPGIQFTYFWQASPNGSSNWTTIDGLTATHTLTGNDLQTGTYLRVEVIASAPGYDTSTVYATAFGVASEAHIIVSALPTAVFKNGAISLTAGTWSPAAYDSISYQWTVESPNGSTTTATSPTIPIAGSQGKYITVTVEHQANGYVAYTTPEIVVQEGAASTFTGSPAVTGSATVGGTLQAPGLTWTPTLGSDTWQWQYKSGSSWKNLQNGTDPAYTPTAADLGRPVRVVTSRIAQGWKTALVDSVAAGRIATGSAPVMTSGGWSGAAATGDFVDAMDSTWTVTPSRVNVQWEYSTTPSGPLTKISGATSPEFQVPPTLVGDNLWLERTTTLAGHAQGSSTTSIGVVSNDLLTVKSAPKVTHSGSNYSVSAGTFAPAASASNEVAEWYYTDNNDANPVLAITSAIGVPENIGAHGPLSAHWYVSVSATATGFNLTKAPAVLVKKGDFTPSAAVTLPASAVDAAITPSTITWQIAGPTVTYQWQYKSGSSWKSIPSSAGGQLASFTPTVAYYNKSVRVVETANKTNYTALSVASASTAIGEGAAPASGVGFHYPGFEGYLGIGSTLTADPGAWNLSGVKFTYKWEYSTDQSTWLPLTPTTATTYKIPDSAYHTDYYRITVTATKTGYVPGISTKALTLTPGTGQMVEKTAPKVTFKNGTYSISNGTWSPAATVWDYTWTVYDPATNAGTVESTTSSYTPSPTDADKKIDVQLYPDATHYNSGGFYQVVHAGPSLQPNSTPQLTGTNVETQTLSVTNIDDWNTGSPNVYLTWYRNGVATNQSINETDYVTGPADVGKAISVKISAAEDGYAGYTTTLTGPTIYSDFGISASLDPVISGAPKVGQMLSVTTGSWNLPGATFAYRWYRAGAAIPGATSSTYTLAPGDQNQVVTAGVTASKSWYFPTEDRAAAVDVVPGTLAIPGANPIVIKGTAALGSTLTTVAGSWNGPVDATYQWMYYDTVASQWDPIYGASSSSYTPTAADGLASGMQLSVTIYGSRYGYNADGYQSPTVTLN